MFPIHSSQVHPSLQGVLSFRHTFHPGNESQQCTIPELHLPFLTDKQRENIRKTEGNYLSQRRVSLYIKEDYIRQRMLDTIVDTLKAFMTMEMLGEGILKYGIKL